MKEQLPEKKITTSSDHSSQPEDENEDKEVKIYFLPNLMTAGNLFCGFLALTKIVEADLAAPNFTSLIRQALLFILLACIFDMLDGRVARIGGRESPFGREFDSLADLISFGAAPAFLVHRIVLEPVFKDQPEIGWFLASIYLVCGALRLARFNCISSLPSAHKGDSKDFIGFPIPAAAALVASITLFMLWFQDKEFVVGYWRYSLPFIMVFLSYMMVSNVTYPSFKNLSLLTSLHMRKSFLWVVIAALTIGGCIVMRKFILPVILPLCFLSYLFYGLIRHFIRLRRARHIQPHNSKNIPSKSTVPGKEENKIMSQHK